MSKKGLVIRVKRLCEDTGRGAERFFLCFPAYGACRLVSQCAETALAGEVVGEAPESAFTAHTCGLPADGSPGIVFHRLDAPPVTLRAREFSFSLRGGRRVPPLRIAGVRFAPEGRAYDYACGELECQPGDWVLSGRNGAAPAEVVSVYETTGEGLPQREIFKPLSGKTTPPTV